MLRTGRRENYYPITWEILFDVDPTMAATAKTVSRPVSFLRYLLVVLMVLSPLRLFQDHLLTGCHSLPDGVQQLWLRL